MKKKTIVLAAFAGALLICGSQLWAQTAAKPAITGFSAMAQAIEKNYGQLLELDLEMKNAMPMYTAKVIINGMKVTMYFNAANGTEVGRKPPEYLDYEDAAVYGYAPGAPAAAMPNTAASPTAPATGAAPGQPAISMEKAREIAIARAGGGTVGKVELDYERGRMVYDMKVYNNGIEYELYVDAQTGEVIKFKQDW